jgi:putative membrane protein
MAAVGRAGQLGGSCGRVAGRQHVPWRERGEIQLGGMMTAASAWILLWTVLGIALAVAGGIWVARILGSRHGGSPPQIRAAGSPGVQEAQDALRLRYAHGEISREEYLQGKVELED